MEAMALESLVASVWRLDGFLALVRHPIRVKSGYSDMEVVGVRGDGAVRIAECKAVGSARVVFVENRKDPWSFWWDGSLANIPRLWESRPPWLPSMPHVKSIEYFLVGNVWFSDDRARHKAENRLTNEVRKHLPKRMKNKGRAVIRSSFELLIAALDRMRNDIVDEDWGKRYGDPLLDAIRELIRYSNPLPSGGGRIKARIREAT